MTPEKIWADPKCLKFNGSRSEYSWREGEWGVDQEDNTPRSVPYTRTDLAEAAERAAYLRGLEDAAKVVERIGAKLYSSDAANAAKNGGLPIEFVDAVAEYTTDIADAIRAPAKEGGE